MNKKILYAVILALVFGVAVAKRRLRRIKRDLIDESISQNTCEHFVIKTIKGEWNNAIDTYCRCNDGSFGLTCQDLFPNPCFNNIRFELSPVQISDKYFVHCDDNLPYLFKCPAGLYWDHEQLTCAEREHLGTTVDMIRMSKKNQRNRILWEKLKRQLQIIETSNLPVEYVNEYSALINELENDSAAFESKSKNGILNTIRPMSDLKKLKLRNSVRKLEIYTDMIKQHVPLQTHDLNDNNLIQKILPSLFQTDQNDQTNHDENINLNRMHDLLKKAESIHMDKTSKNLFLNKVDAVIRGDKDYLNNILKIRSMPGSVPLLHSQQSLHTGFFASDEKFNHQTQPENDSSKFVISNHINSELMDDNKNNPFDKQFTTFIQGSIGSTHSFNPVKFNKCYSESNTSKQSIYEYEMHTELADIDSVKIFNQVLNDLKAKSAGGVNILFKFPQSKNL